MDRRQAIIYDDINEPSTQKLMQLSKSTHLASNVTHILKLEADYIQCLNTNFEQQETYFVNEMECVNLSMCSRYAGGTGRFGGIRTTINIDVDLIMKDGTVLYEIVNPISFQKLIDFLRNNNIEIIDMVGIVDIYQQYPKHEQRVQYLEMNFNELSNKYHLDHPRFKSRFKK